MLKKTIFKVMFTEASAEGASLYRRSVPQKILNSRVSEMLFSALYEMFRQTKLNQV